MRERGHFARDSFLVAVQFAHFQLCADFAVFDVDAAERDVFAQDGGYHAAGDDADLIGADIDTVAVGGGLFAGQIQARQFSLRAGFAFGQRGAGRAA